MAIILIVFNTFFFPEPTKENSLNIISNEDETSQDPYSNKTTSLLPPSSISETKISDELKATYGIFANTAIGEETFHTIENDKLKITVSNKGGRIISVIMKEYQTYDSIPLDLFNSDSSRFNLQLTTQHSINTADLFFNADQTSNSLSMKLKADNLSLIHI